jgi:hypothetical protein
MEVPVPRPAPYIGITGFMEPQEVTTALALFHACDHPGSGLNGRQLMVGALASGKTLRGEKNKWPNRYPVIGDDNDPFEDLFVPDRRALNLIHFSTDDAETLPEQIAQLVALGGKYLDGFQLNMRWPDPLLLARSIPLGYRTVLQLGAAALAEEGNDPVRVAKRITAYVGGSNGVSDVLIDASGGKGIPLDLETVTAYVEAIAHHDARLMSLGIGIAGGLSASTLPQLKSLLKKHPFLSIDAEGKLRDANDDLDPARVTAYIHQASLVFPT